MTKETLMKLALIYARHYMTMAEGRAEEALSYAIDAALTKARSDALEEAAEEVFISTTFMHDEDDIAQQNLIAKAIRALKETK